MVKLSWAAALFFSLFFIAMQPGCGGVKEKRKPPQQLYQEGMKSLEGHRSLFFFHVTDYEGATNAFEEIKNRYSFTSFAPEAELRLADIHFKKEEYSEAIVEYNEFIKLHPRHKEVHYATHQVGLSYYAQITGLDRDMTAPESALSTFETLLEKFPESGHAADAKEKADECKKILAENEFYIGKFYFKKKVYKAAAGRFRSALERFPGFGPKEDAMLYLGKSYMADGATDEGRDILQRVIKAFPGSLQALEAEMELNKVL